MKRARGGECDKKVGQDALNAIGGRHSGPVVARSVPLEVAL